MIGCGRFTESRLEDLFNFLNRLSDVGRYAVGELLRVKEDIRGEFEDTIILADHRVAITACDAPVSDGGNLVPGEKCFMRKFLRAQTKIHAAVVEPSLIMRHLKALHPHVKSKYEAEKSPDSALENAHPSVPRIAVQRKDKVQCEDEHAKGKYQAQQTRNH